MSEVQMTEAEYAYARLGETIEDRLNNAYRRRERQVQQIVHHIKDLRHDLTRLKYEVESENPEGNYGQRSTHWQEHGALQGYGGKLDMRLAVLAGIDDEIRSLRKVQQYLVS